MSQPSIATLQRQALPISLESKTYQGSIGGSNPSDYYRLRLNRSSRLSLNLSDAADADLSLLNGKGRVFQSSFRRAQRSDALSLNLQQGTYYIQVSRRGSQTQYQLSLSVADVPVDRSRQLDPARSLINRVVALTNRARQRAGLRPLRYSRQLSTAAKRHSTDMAANDYFSHTGADGSSPFDRIRAAGYRYSAAAENIAAGYASPEALVSAWMNSPGHRANILNPLLKEIGVGYEYLENDRGNSNYRHYWTQNFGTPMR